MGENYRKEEVTHIDMVPARIIHQILEGIDCYCPLHWHKDIEINLFLRNPACFRVNGEERMLQAGDFILINSGDLHSGLGDPEKPERLRSQELLTIQLDYDFLAGYYKRGDGMRFRDQVPDEVREKFRAILLEIGVLHLHKSEFYEIRMTSLILALETMLLENFLDPDTTARSLANGQTFHQIKSAVEYIDAHYAEVLSLEDISGIMGWAPTYFSRKFKQLTGVTYHEYLCSVRLKHAMDDLIQTDKDITEIAFDCGFPNVKSFIEAFKKAFASTPQKYRGNLRKQTNEIKQVSEIKQTNEIK